MLLCAMLFCTVFIPCCAALHPLSPPSHTCRSPRRRVCWTRPMPPQHWCCTTQCARLQGGQELWCGWRPRRDLQVHAAFEQRCLSGDCFITRPSASLGAVDADSSGSIWHGFAVLCVVQGHGPAAPPLLVAAAAAAPADCVPKSHQQHNKVCIPITTVTAKHSTVTLKVNLEASMAPGHSTSSLVRPHRHI